ncbi:MAG: ankyrin repeat domain-containing protein [Betaproteobacteria bacterium]|nr:ankyrin repeat domain-containing protein [Betaproteobacteria bacterium]
MPVSRQLLLDRLIHSVNKETGVIVLLGSAGVGKTTFLKQLVVDCEGINNLIVRDLSFCLRSVQLSTHALNNAAVMLDTSVVDNSSGANNQYSKTIYLLDHADRVDNDILEKILIAVSENNEVQKDTLLILAGLPNFESQLTNPQFEPYKFLLNNYSTLERLNLREVEDYIAHRLKFAKYVGKTIFTDDAIRRITELSKGIPQVVNILCGNSLLQASLDNNSIVTKETVNIAAEFCVLEQEAAKEEDSKSMPPVAPSEPKQTIYYDTLKLPDLFPPSQTLQQLYQTAGELQRHVNDSAKLTIRPESGMFEAGYNENSHQGYKIALIATIMLSITAILWALTESQLITQDSYSIADSGVVETYQIVSDSKLTLLHEQIVSPIMSHSSIPENTTNLVASDNISVSKPASKIKASTVIKVTDAALKARENRGFKQNIALVDEGATNVKVAQVMLQEQVPQSNAQVMALHTNDLLDQQELATKTRSTARYQLAEKGISYDFQNFFVTVEKGDETLLNLFLEANMPVDIQENLYQNTALITAAAHGHLNVVTTILDKKPAVNKQNKNGQTALISATTNGHYEVSRSLLINGANVHVRDNKGWDALMFAAEQNQVEIVKELLHYGADKNAKDTVGQTALSIAKNKSHFEIVALLQNVH